MLIVDYEGYKIDKNKFIIKEFTLINLKINKTYHYFVRSPFIIKNNHTEWVYNNIHHIPFNYGSTSFKKIITLLKTNENIYVKGLEKTKFIKSISKSPNVINLEEVQCPKYIEKNTINCSFTNHNKSNFNHCSLKKATFFKNWLLENEKDTKAL